MITEQGCGRTRICLPIQRHHLPNPDRCMSEAKKDRQKLSQASCALRRRLSCGWPCRHAPNRLQLRLIGANKPAAALRIDACLPMGALLDECSECPGNSAQRVIIRIIGALATSISADHCQICCVDCTVQAPWVAPG